MRFEITGCAAGYWTCAEIQLALKLAGATGINRRRAFGWRNQPHVATFAAADDSEAKQICEAARKLISSRPFPAAPSLIAWSY